MPKFTLNLHWLNIILNKLRKNELTLWNLLIYHRLFILTVQFLQCKYIQGLIQISQYKIENSILYWFCVCKEYNVALYYVSHFIMHQNISGDKSFIVLNEGYILKYRTRDLCPEVGGKSSLLKTMHSDKRLRGPWAVCHLEASSLKTSCHGYRRRHSTFQRWEVTKSPI